MPQDIIKNEPLSPQEALNNQIDPQILGTRPIISTNRANELTVNDDELKTYEIGLEEIDSAMIYHINNAINPHIQENGSMVKVPVMYAYPEMFKSAQIDGGIRDKDGKILFPIIAIKRDSVNPIMDMSNKLDGNKVNNYRMIEKQFSSKNIYDNFAVLNNRIPVKEYTMVPVPDYCDIVYSCAVYVNNNRDMNRIIEGFMFANNSYWGDKKKNIFYTKIESYPITMEMNVDDNRKIYTIFDIMVKGYILPDNMQRNSSTYKKTISKAQIKFTTETVV